MKTLFIPIYDGAISKNILRTDVFRILKAQFRIVLFVPEKKFRYYQEQFEGPGVVIEKSPAPSHPWFERNFLMLSLDALHTETVRRKISNQLVRDGMTLKYLAKVVIWQLGYFRVLHRFLRAVYALVPDRSFEAAYARYRPSAVFVPTMISNEDYRLIKMARRHRLVAVGMPKSWDNLSTKTFFNILPDWVMLENVTMAEEVERLFEVSRRRVSVVGFPQFDVYADRSHLAPREEFCRALGLDPAKKIIVYAAAGHQLAPNDEQVLDMLIEDIEKSPDLRERVQILVRPHPKYIFNESTVQRAPFVVVDYPGRDVTDKKASWEFVDADIDRLMNTLYHADVLVSTISTLNLEGAYFDKPLISIGFDGRKKIDPRTSVARYYSYEHIVPLVKSGGMQIAWSREELLSHLQRYVDDPSQDSAGRKRILDELVGTIDGKAGERAANFISEKMELPPPERRRWPLPFMTLLWTALTLTVLAPYLFFNQLIAPGADTISYYYPAFYFFSEALRTGQSFLWDPQIFSGFPTYLSQVSGYIEPLNLLLFSVIPDFVVAYHLRLAIDFVLVMVCSYLAARTFGISRFAAFFVGPAYLLAFHWWYLSNTVIANTLFLFPLLLCAYQRGKDAPTLATLALWGVVGGMGVGWAFLGGYAQVVVYALFLVGVFALAEFFYIAPRIVRTLQSALWRALLLASFAVLGFIVGSPQILASMAHVPHTVREGGLDYAVTQYKVLEPQELIYFVFPDYIRFPLLQGGKKPLYLGPLILLGALTAILYVRRNRYAVVFFGMFALTFLLAMPHSPLYKLMHALPIFELFRFPYRWMYLGIFALAILGAMGLDFMRLPERRTRVLALAAALLGSALTAVVAAAALFREWFWRPVTGLAQQLFGYAYESGAFSKPLEHYLGSIERAVVAWRELFISMPFLLPFFALAFAVIVFWLRAYERISYRQFRIVAGVVLIFTFIATFVARWPDTLSADTAFSAHERAVGDLIAKNDLSLWRVHPFNLGASFQKVVKPSLIWNTEDVLAGLEMQFAMGVPNIHRFDGLSSTDGYDPFVPRALLDTLASLGSNNASEEEVKGLSLEARKERLLSNLDVVGRMAGRYIYSGTPLQHRDLQLIGEPRASKYNQPFYIYEYRLATPRVKLSGGTIDSLRTENGHFSLSVNAPGPASLRIAEYRMSGWYATIDGEPAAIEPIDNFYMSIRVPKGEHEVVVQYEGIRGEATWLRMFGLYPYPLLKK